MTEDRKSVADMSFEEAMKALEGVVSQLEHGEVPLDRSIELYERGAALRAHCADLLRRAEERVEKIMLDADGKPVGSTPVEGL